MKTIKITGSLENKITFYQDQINTLLNLIIEGGQLNHSFHYYLYKQLCEIRKLLHLETDSFLKEQIQLVDDGIKIIDRMAIMPVNEKPPFMNEYLIIMAKVDERKEEYELQKDRIQNIYDTYDKIIELIKKSALI